MGCINSRTDINDLHSNIFQVMNVDDFGNLITPGRLEITDVDIVLYQRGKQLVKWPLRCLRRYGYDAEIFSFESGRRCSTGPGIYAFKCRRAAQLFNLVQTNIQACNNSNEDTISREIQNSSLSGPSINRAPLPTEPNYLDPTPVRNNNHSGSIFSHSQQNGIGRLGSVCSSNGPMSPQGTLGSPSPPLTLPPPPPVPSLNSSSLYVNEEVLSTMTTEMEHNNNKNLRRSIQRSSTITSTTSNSGFDSQSIQPHQEASNQSKSSQAACYMNVNIASDTNSLSPSHSNSDFTPLRDDCSPIESIEHPYMNINQGQDVDVHVTKTRPPPLPRLQLEWDDGSRHSYANLQSSEIESLRKRFSSSSVAEKSPLPPSTPPSCIIREVNYAVLDLDKKDVSENVVSENITANTISIPPESPNKTVKGYAVIDFNKTAALSHSVNSNLVNDNEGSRITRHNSTISDIAIPLKYSSFLSE